MAPPLPSFRLVDDVAAIRAASAGLLAEVGEFLDRRPTAFPRPAVDPALPARARLLVGLTGLHRLGAALAVEAPARLVPGAAEEAGAFRLQRLRVEGGLAVGGDGLLLLPPGPGPHPLAVVLHGGQGSPEILAGHLDGENYHRVGLRAARLGFAAWMPRLMLWRPELGPAFDRPRLDAAFKQRGGSLAAFEILRLRRDLDALLADPRLRPARPVVAGLSYGGFYALYAAALEPRFAAVYASNNTIDRVRYPFFDWTWRDSAGFTDVDAASLVCPRPLYLEMAVEDEIFAIEACRPLLGKIGKHYARRHAAFRASEIPGPHAISPTDEGLAFLRDFA